MSGAVSLGPGARFMFDGEVVKIVQLDGTRVTVRDGRDRWRTVSVAVFLAGARSLAAAELVPAAGPLLVALSERERQALAERAGHVREVLTGFRSGSAQTATDGEPRAAYDPALPQAARQEAKAVELGVTGRTIRRWISAYLQGGEAALIDGRRVTGRGPVVDSRWEESCRRVLADLVGASTPTAGAVLARVERLVEEAHGPGVVPVPSRATAYRHLARLTKGTNALRGSAKGRRSIADRPQGVYGRLRAMRPGEYVVLDTQDLDVFAMEPVTCRWVRAQVTIAQDLFTRAILGLRVTAVSTKAVDVASVLYQAMVPAPVPDQWTADACWPYHGLPATLVFSEEGVGPSGPVCPPETLVVDHGKAFLSSHVIGVCAALGISIQPAQPKKPTDKPTVERFFRTLREGLIQHLPAYKGPDIYSRGEHLEEQAFFFLHELEDIIREWVALVYHRTKQDGLAVPDWPRLGLSPNEMFEIGVAKAGLLRVPDSPELLYDFLEVHPRTIQHYGVEVGGLRYNGPALDHYRNSPSPYGGVLAGKWPIRVNPDDVRCVFFQDPADHCWHRLEWEHAAGLGMPFSAEAAQQARRLVAQQGRWPDGTRALAELLDRWGTGVVTDRRERRMAVRLGADRAALPTSDLPAAEALLALPALTGLASPDGGPARLQAVPDRGHGSSVGDDLSGDGEDEEEIFDTPPGEADFYADAFGVID